MVTWNLRFHGVGNSHAVELGSAMATIERDGQPWLTIDCGGEGLTAYLAHYGAYPEALFITHTHLDHVGGFERLFGATYFATPRGRDIRLYVPAPLVPLLQERIAGYPNVVAEGGANFWDAFQLVPVSGAFWHDGMRLETFPVRHHWPDTASACACLAAWSGPGIRGRSRSNWRSSPTPMNSSRTTARCTAILRIAASMTSSANIRPHCSRVARSTITRAPPMPMRWPRAVIASPMPANASRWTCRDPCRWSMRERRCGLSFHVLKRRWSAPRANMPATGYDAPACNGPPGACPR